MSAPRIKLSYEAYLALEARAGLKHEYVNGEAYDMAGGTPEHARLSLAVGAALSNALQNKPCTPYSSDLKIRVEATHSSFYPDASVVCGKVETSRDDQNAVINPAVLVEVLSEGTAAYDRGAKAQHYRRIQSLKEYVLVNFDERLIEVQRRNANGFWEIHIAGPGELAELPSMGVSLNVDAIYAHHNVA